MLVYAAKRLLLALVVAAFVSLIAFSLLRLSGDVAIALAGEGARAEDIERVRAANGLDRPLLLQYLSWAASALSGDLGQSLYFNTSVASLIRDKLLVTLTLGLLSITLGLLIAIIFGVSAAVFRGSWIDQVALAIAVIGQALPNFLLALILIMLFSVQLRWLPASGSQSWQNFVLPAITLGIYVMPPLLRLVRSGMIDVLSMDYIRTARAKGLSPASVIFKHALRNAMMPVVSLTAVQLGLLLGGSIVIETVFALDGLGYLGYQSITHKDFPVMQAVLLLLSIIFVLLTLVSDLINAWLDPRVRLS